MFDLSSPKTSIVLSPPSLLQYQRRRKKFGLVLVEPYEDLVDSHRTQLSEPTTDQSESSDDLPTDLKKSSRLTHNPHSIYNFLSFHLLSASYLTFFSLIFFRYSQYC